MLLLLAVLLAPLLLAPLQASQAQTPSVTALADAVTVRQWTVADGLPVNAVYDLQRDRAGFLWLATHDGLVRFDGMRFEVFDTATVPALPSNRFSHLAETADGVLWARTDDGQVVRHDAPGRFAVAGPEAGLPQAPIQRFLTTADGPTAGGTLYVAHDQGVHRYDAEAGRFLPVHPEHIGSGAWAVYRARDGALWVALSGAVLRFDAEGDAVRRWTQEADDLPASFVTAIGEGPGGAVWLGAFDGFRRSDGEQIYAVTRAGDPLPRVQAPEPGGVYTFDDEPLPPSVRPDSTVVLSSRRASVAVRGGRVVQARAKPVMAVYVTPDGHTWEVGAQAVRLDGRDVVTLDSRTIDTAMTDDGTLWLASLSQGLVRVRPSGIQTLSVPEGLAGRNVYGMHRTPEGVVWIATTDGLSRYRAGTLTTFGRAGEGRPDVRRPSNVTYTLSVHQDRRGVVWVGSRHGLCRLGRAPVPEGAACTPVPLPLGTVTPDLKHVVQAIYEARDGTLWAGTLRRGALMRPATHPDAADPLGGWRHVPGTDTLARHVRAFYETQDGAVWMATGQGLARYARPEGAAPRLETITPADGLPIASVREIIEEDDGTLWVGTEGGGLVRLRVTTDPLRAHRLDVIRARDGLPDDAIHRLLPDDDGRLWMSTNEGLGWAYLSDLHRFADGRDLDRFPTVYAPTYDEADGMRSREANGGSQEAGFRTPLGKLWFPTQDGVAILDPARLLPLAGDLPSPRIEHVTTAAGEVLRPDDVPAGGRLRLAPDARSFTARFTAPSLDAPGTLRYRYRLDGYDTRWRTGPVHGQASYTQVPPGRYTFRVAVDRSHEAVREAAVPLYVVPRLHETRTFWTLLALLAFALSALAVRRRLRAGQRREHELERQVQARTEELAARGRALAAALDRAEALSEAKSSFLASMSHEIRTPLTSIVGFAEVLTGELDGPQRQHAELVLRSSERLRETLTSVLDFARLEADRMPVRFEAVDLAGEAEAVVQEMRLRAWAKGLTLGLVLDTPAPCYVRADGRHLGRVLVNLVSNAIKYTEAGGITVTVFAEDKAGAPVAEGAQAARCGVRVTDTGIGMSEAFLDELFVAFRREMRDAVQEQEGSGLGLVITRQLVEMMGGTLAVESTLDVGSRFTVRLAPDFPPETQEPETQEPETQEPETQEPETQEPETQEPETKEPEAETSEADETKAEAPGSADLPPQPSPTSPELHPVVLLVTTSAAVRRLMQAVLLDRTRLDCVHTPTDALRLARQHRYDAVFADARVLEAAPPDAPDGATGTKDADARAGHEAEGLLARVRALPYGADLPVVAITPAPWPAEACMRRGVAATLTVPFARHDVLALLHRLLHAEPPSLSSYTPHPAADVPR